MSPNKCTLQIRFLMLLLLVILVSCKKKESADKDTDTAAASENNYAEHAINDLSMIGDQAGWSNNTNTLTTYKVGDVQQVFLLSCVQSITRDTINKVITVDFGGTPNLCQDGRTRAGKIEYQYSGGARYRDSGVVIKVNPINYSVDGNKISGSKSIKNLGRINGNFTWSIEANMEIQKANNGGKIKWSCSRTKVLLNTPAVYQGPNAPIKWASAKIGLMGTANGTTAGNDNFTLKITSQLIRDFSCSPDPSKPHRHPFIQGNLEFTPGIKATRFVNFGAGTCDLDATVTINGNAFSIKLH